MERISVQGVIRNGQVVLEVPLDQPDGTVVTVTLSSEEEYKRNLLTMLNRLDLMNDPDWKAKAEPERIVYIEQLVLEAVEMRFQREATAHSEQQRSQSRGSRE